MRRHPKIHGVFSTEQIAHRQRRAAMTSEGKISTEQKGNGLAFTSLKFFFFFNRSEMSRNLITVAPLGVRGGR